MNEIAFAQYKNELHLTVSARLTDNNADRIMSRIKTLQRHLISAFPQGENMGTIETAAALRQWGERPDGQRLYVCPYDTLHFSMLDFVKVPLNSIDFESERGNIGGAEWFERFQQYIENNV